MYILKNAWISISRNKGRNILIAILIFVIAIASTVTLAIRNAASRLIDSYYDAYQVEATIGMSRENIMGELEEKDKDTILEKMILYLQRRKQKQMI